MFLSEIVSQLVHANHRHMVARLVKEFGLNEAPRCLRVMQHGREIPCRIDWSGHDLIINLDVNVTFSERRIDVRVSDCSSFSKTKGEA